MVKIKRKSIKGGTQPVTPPDSGDEEIFDNKKTLNVDYLNKAWFDLNKRIANIEYQISNINGIIRKEGGLEERLTALETIVHDQSRQAPGQINTPFYGPRSGRRRIKATPTSAFSRPIKGGKNKKLKWKKGRKCY